MTKSKMKESNLPCPVCPSSDAYVTYDNGWGHCFSCGKNLKLGKEIDWNVKAKYEYQGHRGIPKSTFEKYGVSTKIVDDIPVAVRFPYSENVFKIRAYDEYNNTWPKDRGSILSQGNMSEASLFGMGKFNPGREVIITEGEFDALATYTITQVPSVSVRSSSSARRDCEKAYDYLNAFDKIYLAFDNDEPGRSASRKVSQIFDFNKLFVLDLGSFNDPNEFLQKNQPSEFLKVWKRAKKYTPDNIISSFSEIEESLVQGKDERIGTYPFGGLQTALYGLHRGEVVCFKGAEGIGKTELFRAMEHHLLKEHKETNIGILHLEEDKSTTIKGLATYQREYPFLHLEDTSSKEDIMSAYKECVDGQETRVYIYDSFDVEDDEKLLDNIRFLVSVCNCQFIFLDHITWLATGLQNEDERRKLDRISQKLKLLAKELSFCLVMISHTNDEGKTRGSRNITKVANTVIQMSRDITSESDSESKKLRFVVEKARGGGTKAGNAHYASFDTDTLRLIEPVFEDPSEDGSKQRKELSFD